MSLLCRCAAGRRPPFQRPALVVGHPGHELKVFGWMKEFHPRVHVLTDGSGRHGVSRIPASEALLARLGTARGEIFGRLSDGEMYRAILEQRPEVFCGLVDELAASFLRHGNDSVVGDAQEGFNPTHDVCRMLIDAAVQLVKQESGVEMANLAVSLTEWERERGEPVHDDACLHWVLEEAMLAEKVQAAKEYVELKGEVERALAEKGPYYFRLECMRPGGAHLPAGKPQYETWGEKRVAEGEYRTVIRCEKHVAPIVQAVREHVAAKAPALAASPR